MARVDCEHLVKAFTNERRALDDVTLDAGDGEILVLVGPSGCGKSTLLRIVAGLETADSGAVRIGNRDVTRLSPAERNVAMVFQDYALYPHMTVRGNLEFPLRVRRIDPSLRRRRVEDVAALLGIGELLERYPKQLSGGQRQRVAMGRALVREPTVSLLDEPLSNLDAKLRGAVRAEIADLQRRTGTTMIYVTHDQVEAMTLGHRVAVLNGGRLQQLAAPAELYARPANVFVASFLGSPPMNLLLGSIDTTVGAPVFHLERWRIPLGGAAALPDPRALSQTSTIGIRPEKAELTEIGEPGTLDAGVEHVEMLGSEVLVHCRIGSGKEPQSFVVRADVALAPKVGASVGIALPSAHVHFFDEAGSRLGPSEP